MSIPKQSPSPRPKTIILDIDGCILRHYGDMCRQITRKSTLLPDVKNQFTDWDRKGYCIILLTGRRESIRSETEKQLTSLGLFWDQLVMGATGGQRILINDLKPNDETPTAVAINIPRNEGLQKVDLN